MSDISRLRIDVPGKILAITAKATVSKAKGRSIQGRFLRGPIPLDWLQQAALLPGRALHMALRSGSLTGSTRPGPLRQNRNCSGSLAWTGTLHIGHFASWKKHTLYLRYANKEKQRR